MRKTLLTVLLLVTLCSKVFAQGAGIYVRPNCPTTVTNPVVGYTWCLDSITNVIWAFTNVGWLAMGGATFSSSLNGAISVQSYPYLAKGNGSSDDTLNINSAISNACSGSGGTSTAVNSVALSSTPNGCYKITAPIQVPCSLHIMGAGIGQTYFCPSMIGPAFLVQNTGVGANAPPLTSSVTATWQSSHSYTANTEILDPNGKVEVVKTAGTSGSGPTWCTGGFGCTTTDGGVTWAQGPAASTGLTGAGPSLDFVGNPNEILSAAWVPQLSNLTKFGSFTVEVIYGQPYVPTNTSAPIIGTTVNNPLPTGVTALQGALSVGWQSQASGGCLNTSTACLTFESRTANTATGAGSANATALPIAIHNLALTYDGTTFRLFQDGVIVSTRAATGNLAQYPFESFNLGAMTQSWPDQGVSSANFGYVDSIRISNTARYTANYSSSLTRFAGDSNTLLLINPTTSNPSGTIQGSSPFNSSANVYIPYETGNSSATLKNVELDHFDMCHGSAPFGGGIYGSYLSGFNFHDIICSTGGLVGIDLADNDSNGIERNIEWSNPDSNDSTAPYLTSAAFANGNLSNGNLYEDLTFNGGTTGVYVSGGSGEYHLIYGTDPQNNMYDNFYFTGGWGTIIHPSFIDTASGSTNFVCNVRADNTIHSVSIYGGELDTPNTTASHLCQNGGLPIEDFAGTVFAGQAAANVVNIIANPTSSVMLEGAQYSGTLTNTASQVYSNQNGSVLGAQSACQGTKALTAGAGTVSNSCISATKFTWCVDTTAANSVTCTPSNGSLSIAGTTTDTIAWYQ